jgi:hypothetical protein
MLSKGIHVLSSIDHRFRIFGDHKDHKLVFTKLRYYDMPKNRKQPRAVFLGFDAKDQLISDGSGIIQGIDTIGEPDVLNGYSDIFREMRVRRYGYLVIPRKTDEDGIAIFALSKALSAPDSLETALQMEQSKMITPRAPKILRWSVDVNPQSEGGQWFTSSKGLDEWRDQNSDDDQLIGFKCLTLHYYGEGLPVSTADIWKIFSFVELEFRGFNNA